MTLSNLLNAQSS